MKNVFIASQKLFFNILIICLLSYIYFTILPMNEITLTLGLIFCIFYFGCNFYTGYRYDLKLLEALIAGIIGCGIGIFLGIFAIYTQSILQNPDIAIWMIMPYFIPTLSITKIFSITVTLDYAFILMIINVLLVIIGSITKNIMNKFFTIFK